MSTSDPPSAAPEPNTDPADVPRARSCLVLHGLGGGPYELSPLIAALESDGLTVSVPLLPGHEGPGPVMPASRWDDWASKAESAFDDLAALGGPVSVLGFSTGATLSLYLATRRPVARQVLLAPFLAIRHSRLIPIRPLTYLRHIARVIPNLPRRRAAIRDRVARKALADSSCFRTFNLNAALSALELIDEVTSLVPRITVPTLIIQGRRDSVVEPSNAVWLHQHLGATEKLLATMPHSDHLLALDHDREQVIALARDFLVCGKTSNARSQGV